MLELEVVIARKVYATTSICALENMPFSVTAGEFVAIVGPSGAGKSTLLSIIAGLDRDLEGEVRLNGKSLLELNQDSPPIGFMFQESRLMPWLTVLQNVRLVLGNRPDADSITRSLLEQVGLEEFENAFPGQLSGGMQRRVALVRAFAIQPKLLLMDEPFLSLDAPTATRLRELLLQLWKAHAPTVVFVTHNLREALAMADRVLFLSERPGRVVLSLPVELRRPRDLEDRKISELRDQLLAEHPDLLSGLAADDANSQGNRWAPVLRYKEGR